MSRRHCAALLLGLHAASCGAQPSTHVREEQPLDPEHIDEALREGRHKDWEHWSAVGPTLGDKGARVYLNDTLVESLLRGSRKHPVGAAAVRELYAEDFETLIGYSATLKVSDEDSSAWHWFERLELAPDSPPKVDTAGAAGCISCHQAGIDFVQSTLPLP